MLHPNNPSEGGCGPAAIWCSLKPKSHQPGTSWQVSGRIWVQNDPMGLFALFFLLKKADLGIKTPRWWQGILLLAWRHRRSPCASGRSGTPRGHGGGDTKTPNPLPLPQIGGGKGNRDPKSQEKNLLGSDDSPAASPLPLHRQTTKNGEGTTQNRGKSHQKMGEPTPPHPKWGSRMMRTKGTDPKILKPPPTPS